jgi:GNAT superfamily N-acetyltransferase
VSAAPGRAADAAAQEAPRISGYEPGALGRVVELHGRWYARHWKFGAYFEALVAQGLAEFLGHFDAARDGFWIARLGETVAGSVSLVGARDAGPARLRWFILDEGAQGRGIGRRLMQAAMDFSRAAGYRHVYLTTFAGLDAARALYEKHGFVLTHEAADRTWGVPVTEQRFDWHA